MPKISLSPSQSFDCNEAWKVAGIGKSHPAKVDNTNPQWQKIHDDIKARFETGFIYLLLGPRGTGKTQLAACLIGKRIVRDVTKSRPVTPHCIARYIKVVDIFIALRTTMNNGKSSKSEAKIIDELSRIKFLEIDEVQERKGSDWEGQILTHIIDNRYANKLDTLLIGNTTIDEIGHSLGPSIMSRMTERGGVIEMKWESFRQNVA